MTTYNTQQQSVIVGQPQSYGVPVQTAPPSAPPGYVPPQQGIKVNRTIILNSITCFIYGH